MHLTLSLYGQYLSNDKRHPQEIMRELGVSYQHAVPQSLMECWWFFNCENVPKDLPTFIKELKINPMDAVGRGLSEEEARRIVGGRNA